MTKLIDMHVHSTFSDGTNTPAQLVSKAKEAGLSAFALTDHDTTDGIFEILSAAKNSGIEVIPGIEISAGYKGARQDIHNIVLFCVSLNLQSHKQIIDYNFIDNEMKD